MEGESDLDREASPPTSDDEATAFAEQEIAKEKELEQELTKRLQGATQVSQS